MAYIKLQDSYPKDELFQIVYQSPSNNKGSFNSLIHSVELSNQGNPKNILSVVLTCLSGYRLTPGQVNRSDVSKLVLYKENFLIDKTNSLELQSRELSSIKGNSARKITCILQADDTTIYGATKGRLRSPKDDAPHKLKQNLSKEETFLQIRAYKSQIFALSTFQITKINPEENALRIERSWDHNQLKPSCMAIYSASYSNTAIIGTKNGTVCLFPLKETTELESEDPKKIEEAQLQFGSSITCLQVIDNNLLIGTQSGLHFCIIDNDGQRLFIPPKVEPINIEGDRKDFMERQLASKTDFPKMEALLGNTPILSLEYANNLLFVGTAKKNCIIFKDNFFGFTELTPAALPLNPKYLKTVEAGEDQYLVAADSYSYVILKHKH